MLLRSFSIGMLIQMSSKEIWCKLSVQSQIISRTTKSIRSVYTFGLTNSKPVYSNRFFAAKNGKKEPIVRKNDENSHKM